MNTFCATCGKELPADWQFPCCPYCGNKLPKLPENNMGSSNSFSLGDANAIAGDMNVNVDSHNTVTNIVNERQKHYEELLQERKILYINACKRAFEDNVLDQSEKNELDSLRIELGLDEATADELLDQVRQIAMRNASKTELTGLAKIKLKQLSEAMKKNEVQAIIRQIDSLESLAEKFSNDELQYKYYLVLAALRHEKCIEKYENSKVDNYWKSYWTYFAYLKSNNAEAASDILYSLGDKFPNYPEDNIAILAAAGSFIMNSNEAAQDYLTAVGGDYSPILQCFVETIYLLLDPDTAKEMGAAEQGCTFYFINIIQSTKDINVSVKNKKTFEHNLQHAIEEREKYKKLNEIYNLGYDYYHGRHGKTKNYIEALKWFRMAAEQGHADAQFDLGMCYEYGRGVSHDYSEAVKWYRKAAEKGLARAQYQLGYCYYHGNGVSHDYSEAVKWFRMAAEQGYADAQCFVGSCYYNAKGVSQDYEEAVKWFRKAVEQGQVVAQRNLGMCYYNGDGVAQNYSEAVKWFRMAAEQGHADAQVNLGMCYYNGDGVPQNYSEAVKWFRMAAEQGHARAQYNLGYCYYNGEGVSQDYSEAVKWLRMAAEQEHADAQVNLGVCYEYGEGVSQDYSEAVKWYREAAEQGDACAQSNLGECYYFGHGVPQDYDEARKWWRKAADQGYQNAVDYLNGKTPEP